MDGMDGMDKMGTGEENSAMITEPLIPKHGGYRRLKSFQLAQLCYDVTVRFCDRYITEAAVLTIKRCRPRAAEGSKASGTSKKMELKLTNVARASLEELRLDYEDFLRQRRLSAWAEDDPRRRALIERRCTTADEVAEWVKEIHGADGPREKDAASALPSVKSMPSIKSSYPEIAANAALVLIGVAAALLDRQIAAQAASFAAQGGFTERLHRIRTERRRAMHSE